MLSNTFIGWEIRLVLSKKYKNDKKQPQRAEDHTVLLGRVFKLLLAGLSSRPIKYRVQERQPIRERLQSISLKSRLKLVS